MIDAIRVHNLDSKSFKKCDATVCRLIQMYKPNDEKFHIVGRGLPLRNNDIHLMFGVQCERDEEGAAKLLCLDICAKLFFATTGESIGWAFTEGFVLDVDPLNMWDERGVDVDMPDVDIVEPSFDCWQPDSRNGGHIDLKGVSESENQNSETSNNLSSTLVGDIVRTDSNDLKDELNKAMKRINDLDEEVKTKSAQVRELDSWVESIEKMLGAQTTNLFIGFDSVIGAKDAEIARLNKMVDRIVVVDGIEVVNLDKIAVTSPGHKMTSLIRHIKNKPRREFRLSNYEYLRVIGHGKLSDKVSMCKTSELGVIYNVEDVDVERKT
ncbi:hypothetical protein ACSBR2_001461 [Camellia fascicularis]